MFAHVDTAGFIYRGCLRDELSNLQFELEQFARKQGANVSFNLEARERFLKFATSPDAAWSSNFRDLNAAVTRMATLAGGGRISTPVVDAEIDRLKQAWAPMSQVDSDSILDDLLSAEEYARIDPFDRVQLNEVLRTCRRARSLSEAGRMLFSASRQLKTNPNDADRLRKYLAHFGLAWDTVSPQR